MKTVFSCIICFIFSMNFILLILTGLYFIFIVERISIRKFFYENSSDTNGINMSFFSYGFVSPLCSSMDNENESLHVTNAKLFPDLPVRHLHSFKYVILIHFLIFRNRNSKCNCSRADNSSQNSKIFRSNTKRYVECRLGVGGLANKMFGLVSSFVIAALLNATLICMTDTLRLHLSSIQ